MGNDLSSIINLGHQSIATTPIKVIVETSHDTSSQTLISTLSLNPTKQYWSELCHHFITYDYASSCNTRLLSLLKDIYPTARLSTYKLRFHNGYCTIIKPKWSSNYDIDIPRIDAYLDVNVSFCDVNNPNRFGPYDTICRGLLRGMDRNSTPEEQAARLRRPRVTLQIVKLYGMENNEVDIDCTPYPIYKELTKVLYVTERNEYQGYCEDIQVKDAFIDGDVMGYKRLFPNMCKEQQVKRVDVSNGNTVSEMKETDEKEMDASDSKPKAQDMATTKKDESSSSSDSSDSSDSESENEGETKQSMAKKNEPQKEETSLVNEKVDVNNKDESSSSSSDSDSESEDEKEEAKQSSTKDESSSSSSDSDSSDSSDSEEEEEVNVKDKQASKEATRKEDDKTSAKNQDESSSSSSSSSSDSSDSEDESPIPIKKDSPSKAVSKESPTKQEVAPTDKVSKKKKVSTQKNTEVSSKQSQPNSKKPAKEKQEKTKATEPKKPTNSIQDTKVPARLKNKRKREQNATKENGDKTSSNNAGDQPKKKRKANIMTGRYAKEIAAAKSAAAKPSTINDHKKKSTTPKKKPDPNEPRRPKNGFYLFCDSVRAQLTAQNPGLPPKDIQVLMRKEYKSLSKSQLTAWKEVAKQSHEQYRIELEAYEKTLKKDD